VDDPLATEVHHLRTRVTELEQRLSQQSPPGVLDRYRALFLRSTDAIGILDVQGRYLEQNPAHAGLLEYSDAELCGQTPALYMEQPAFAAIGRQLSDKGTFRGEIVARTKSGRSILVDASFFTILDRNGAPDHSIGMYRDITCQRAAEDARRCAQRVMEIVPDHLSIIGRDYRYRRVNPLYLRAHGLPEDRILGAHVADIVGQDAFANLVKPHLDRCFNGEEVAYDAWFTFRSASPQYMAVCYSPLWALNGTVEAVVVIARDITTAKEAEEEFRRANRELETRVSERTQSLESANAALRLSEERFRTLYEDTPSMYFTVDQAGSVLSVNRFGAQQLGFEPDELIGHSVLQVFPEDQREPASQALARAFQVPSETHRWKFRKNRKDGTELWVEETVRVVKSVDGSPVALIDCRDITEFEQAEAERRRAEEQLRNTTDQLETLVRLSPLSIVSLDEQARVLRWNPAAERMFGWSKEEVLGRELPYVPPGMEQEADALWEKGLAGLIQQGIEMRRQRKDGRLIDISLWPAISRDQNGRITSIFGILEEITARKETEAALRASEERFRHVVEAAPSGMILVDHQGLIRLVNARLEQQFGYGRAELIGQSVEMLLPERYRMDHPTHRGRFFAVPETRSMGEDRDLFARHRDGHEFPIEIGLNPIQIHEGTQVLVSIVDISERKQAEASLRKQRAFLRQVIDISPNFVLAKDRDGRFTLANQAVADAYGTTVESLVGKTDADFSVNRKEVAHFRDRDLRVFDTGAEIFIREEPLTDSTGKVRWLQTVKRPLLNEQGVADHVLVIATDITERRAGEQALRRSEEHLRLALEERERLSQDLHDGILQSLYGVGLGLDAAGRVMGTAPRKARREFAHSISQLNRTIEEVRGFITGLHLDALEGDRFKEALKSVVGVYGTSRKIQSLVQVSPRAAAQLTQQQRLHLLNLAREAVSNSIRHGRAREVRVSLRTYRGAIQFEIRDNGSGFDPATTKTAGFGLNNMTSRAAKLGGRFRLQSRVGHGTRVVIDLPQGGPHE
jgi:PAS domain S-box-containing protein